MSSSLPPTTGNPYRDLSSLQHYMFDRLLEAAEIIGREPLPAEGEMPDVERIVQQRAAALAEIRRARHGG